MWTSRPVDSGYISPKYEIWDAIVDTSHLALCKKIRYRINKVRNCSACGQSVTLDQLADHVIHTNQC